MYKTKLNKILNLIEQIKNDINLPIVSEFLEWFYEKIDIHFNIKTPNLKFKKGDIYFVNLGKNIGSELNKTRPCIVYSIKKANFGDTIIIIPLKSHKGGKIIKDFQIFFKGTKNNNLSKDSVCDISGIKQISKKRILNKIGFLEDEILKEIDNKILKIFGLQKNKE